MTQRHTVLRRSPSRWRCRRQVRLALRASRSRAGWRDSVERGLVLGTPRAPGCGRRFSPASAGVEPEEPRGIGARPARAETAAGQPSCWRPPAPAGLVPRALLEGGGGAAGPGQTAFVGVRCHPGERPLLQRAQPPRPARARCRPSSPRGPVCALPGRDLECPACRWLRTAAEGFVPFG